MVRFAPCGQVRWRWARQWHKMREHGLGGGETAIHATIVRTGTLMLGPPASAMAIRAIFP